MADENIVLAEGPDDQQAIFHLLRSHGIETRVKVDKTTQGISDILRGLRQRLRPGTLACHAIVIDADADVEENIQFEARWQSIRDSLRHCGYTNMPEHPNPDGTIIDHDELPRVGVWLMPDNINRGMLEDFARLLITDGDLLYPFARTCVDSLPERRFRDVHLSKAYLHTWLAWQKEPGKPIGQAITKRYLDPNAPQAQQFIAWLRRLFNLDIVASVSTESDSTSLNLNASATPE
jgi:hypothetical protein